MQGGGVNVFLLHCLMSKTLGKLYAGPGLSAPMGTADNRCDLARGSEDHARPPNLRAHPTPFVALLFAHAIAEAALLALLQSTLRPKSSVPRAMLGRTLYSSGHGVCSSVLVARARDRGIALRGRRVVSPAPRLNALNLDALKLVLGAG